ncbi:hypothetical protein [Cupriavidus sp. L7L]|uniref:hypothetical protein n=1 Tax=Cupriavidus sp. L7L TaxID=2546443 RepID=UPI0010541DF1|nr:hypothetical protein [Cupriavidus sp. L7L]TDF62552.1 hypothetical protein E1J61_28945 [Cupriavidus sp. L7L]
MVHIRRVPILLAAATLAWAPVTFSASPSTDAQHEQHHPKEQPRKPAPAAARPVAPQATGNADLDAQIAHLRAIRERLSRANTPEERQALMVERNKVTQDTMAIMHKDMMGMGMGMAGPGGMPSPKGKATASQMQTCQDMMGQHMAFMQEMMQMMMENQGMMGGGMGSGMGAPGMVGK